MATAAPAEEPLAKNSGCTEYFARLREDAASTWKSLCMQHSPQGSSGPGRVTWGLPGMGRAPRALEGHSCPPWLRQLPNGAAANACLFAELFRTQNLNRWVLTWAPTTHFRRCREASAIRPFPGIKTESSDIRLTVAPPTEPANYPIAKMVCFFLLVFFFVVGFLFRRHEPLPKYCLFAPSLSIAQYIARISISFCSSCNLK